MGDSTDIPSSGIRRGHWTFGPAVFDETRGRLVIDGRPTVLDHSTHGILLCLLRHAGEVVRKDALFEAGWPGRVTSESSLTKAIHRLRQALGDADGTLIATIHGYGYQLTAETTYANGGEAGAAPANGNGAAAERVRAGAPPVRRWPLVAALTVTCAALAFLVVRDHWMADAARPAAVATAVSADAASAAAAQADARPSIAVTRFKDMSTGGDHAYLSDGVAEALVNLLSRIPQLRVAPRRESFALGDEGLTPPEVARRLDVDVVLLGSVQRMDGNLLIRAELVRGLDGTRLWQESYERPPGELLALEREIATSIAGTLKVRLVGLLPLASPIHPEAYPLIIEADALANRTTAIANQRAIELYERAIAVSPREPWAWSGLGRVYSNQAAFGERPRAEAVRLAKRALEKAIEIDPDDALTYAQMGYVLSNFDGDPRGAARYYQTALAIAPNHADVLPNIAVFLQTLGRIDDALAIAQYTVRKDPDSAVKRLDLAIDHYYLGQWDEAIAASRKALELSPDITGAQALIGTSILLGDGDASAALDAMRAEANDMYRLSGLAMANHALGRHAASNAALAEMIADQKETAPALIGGVYAYRGEPDPAFEWLEKAITHNDAALQYLNIEPLFWPLRDDPRWLPLLRRVGQAPEQLAAIPFEFEVPKEPRAVAALPGS